MTKREDFLDDRKLQAVARERERNAVVTSGRAATAVGHVKNSLMLRMDTFTNVKVEPEPERNVIVKTIDAADSVEKMRVEAERKKREEENRKRLEAIQKMYLKKTEDDAYNQRLRFACLLQETSFPFILPLFWTWIELTRKRRRYVLAMEV